MNVVEYLKARRAVETADPGLVEHATKLAEAVKAKNLELVSVEKMWDELLRLAESEQSHSFEVD